MPDRGVGVIAGRLDSALVACAVSLETPGVTLQPVRTAALREAVAGEVLSAPA